MLLFICEQFVAQTFGAKQMMRNAKIAVLAAAISFYCFGSAFAQHLTAPQNNAVRSAVNYINFSGFSRVGLIVQLSSPYGDKYNAFDATVAVDSLNIDWNAQAVKSAKQYLSFSGFSCDGLIDQLSSIAGDKYTVEQARYGATMAGACQ